jgi:tetratricopeptide (TPR) repeat protein
MRIFRSATLLLASSAWVLAALTASSAEPDRPPLLIAQSQNGATEEDDPFADELNPLRGRRQPGRPAAAPTQPAEDRPKAGPEEPAEEPAPKPAAPAAKPPAPKPPAPAPQLPVPFPDAESPPATQREEPRGMDDETDEEELSPAEKKLLEAEQFDMQGDLEAARAKVREAITLDPKLTRGYLALGVLSRRLGDYEASVEACSQGLLVDPLDSELLLRRGIAWFYLGMFGIALEDFEDAAGIAYEDPRTELWRGLTLIELDRPLEAINAYASSIRRDRSFMLAYLNRGLAYLSTGEPRKAEFDFDHAIRHDPRDVRAWFNRGVAQARQEKFADAIRSYKAALRLDPSHEPARRNLAAAERMQAH